MIPARPLPCLIAGLCAGLASAAISAAEPPPPEADRGDPLAAGLTCYADLDYACAVELLGAACTQPGLPAERLGLGLARLAESHLALGQREAAVAALSRLLELSPGPALPADSSPKLRAALEETRRRRAPPPPSPDAAGEGPAEEPARLRLGIAGGGEFLLGRDADLLDHGPLLELAASLALNPLVRLGLGLRWAQHGIASIERDEALQTVAAWLGIGLAGDLGPVGLSASLGVGVHHFGVIGEEAKTGLWLPVHLGADVRLLPALRLGLGFTPALTVLPDERRTSTTLGLTADLQLDL